jgi:hypothetical protein
MEKRVRLILSVACIALASLTSVQGDTTVTVDPSAGWVGFMNVFEIPQNGGGYVFGSGWGTADLKATFSGPVLTLSENNIGDPNPFWYIGGGGPGAIGNKTMDASMYVEPAGSLPGQTVTFTGDVLANTLVGQTDALGNGWTSVAFIKDFAPDFSSFVSTTVALTPGVFSISLATINDPARHVQYGFETIGPDVWGTDAGLFGDIQVTAVPEPSSIALALTGLLGLVAVVRKHRP